MLLTGQPDLFFDRVDRSDGPWKAAAADPARSVSYLLMSTDRSADLLSQMYPEAAAGTDPRLLVVYKTSRYMLVGVPTTFSPQADDAATGTATPSGTEESP